MNWLVIGGLSIMVAPIVLFQIGKCHIKRELRKNILELQKIKENSNEEIAALIEIHFAELEKLDTSLFKMLKKEN